MDKDERNTHFQEDFAKLVYDEIEDAILELEEDGRTPYLPLLTFVPASMSQRIKQVLAERAYDLLIHDRLHTGTSDLQHAASYLEAKQMVNGIPDLTQWPTPSPTE